MTKPIIRIHDLTTGEIIDREMSDAEFKSYEANEKANLAKQAEATAKETQRQAILDRLGITQEEANLLLG
jgi:signal-transduction protein with cAMP-binding, CBS, and nucleotidyltransferase domain